MAERIVQRATELASLSVFADCFGADLYPLARELAPLHAAPGDVLMRQGDAADFFLIIASGRVQASHQGADGATVVAELGPGRIVGEIALLRNSPRIATVIATEELSGWVGGDDAFDLLIFLPGVLTMLMRTARQRLAAFVTPIPVRLDDGAELLLRPALPGDIARTAYGPVEFSAETLYRRFQSSREPTKKLMRYLFEVDYVDHFVWLITTEDGDPVGDARFVRDPADRTTAEIAFTVGDDYQGRGTGTFLMSALAIAAHAGGIEKFSARVLSDNVPMRTIMDRAGAQWEREDVGVVSTVIDVPTELPLDAETAELIEDVVAQVLRAL